MSLFIGEFKYIKLILLKKSGVFVDKEISRLLCKVKRGTGTVKKTIKIMLLAAAFGMTLHT
ncbi:hypothetical protein, partial [Bacillus cereus]